MGRKSSRYESPNRLRVRKNRRVKMHYRVCLASGEEFDASAPDSPLEIVCGRGETILGLEKRILGMQPGDEREFIIPPEEAFGVHDAELMKTIACQDISHKSSLGVGRQLFLRDKGTQMMGRIVEIGEEAVTADFNHPLAGEALHYQIQIVQVDEAVLELLPA
jgi:FKBP-type peptidyl-prolyl cis-trans isomerase 2